MQASITIPSLMESFLTAGHVADAAVSLGLILVAILAFYAAMWLYWWSRKN